MKDMKTDKNFLYQLYLKSLTYDPLITMPQVLLIYIKRFWMQSMMSLTKKDFQRGAIKLTKRLLVTYLIAFITLSGTGLVFLFNPWSVKETEAAWFNDNWGYRKRIDVTVTSSGSNITNLDTLLTIDTTGITANLQTNCEDLRFTNANGNILPHFIDTCTDNSATNKVWVRADLVPMNSTVYTIYMYYGNPTAVSSSDSNTFNLYNGLKRYYTMNESSWTNDCSTGTVVDSSANGDNGTSCPDTTGPTTPASAQYGNGGSFDGSNDYVNSTYTTHDSSFTASIWVYADVVTGTRTYMSKQSWSGGNNGFYLRQSATSLEAGLQNSATSQDVSATDTVSATTWTHVAMTYDGTTIKLYKNGTMVNTREAVYGSVAEPLKIGAGYHGDNEWFDGVLDDARYYNRVLSDTEIAQLYSNPGTITTAATATSKPSTNFGSEEKAPAADFYWKFDDAQGSTAQDSSPNNEDITLAASTANPTWSYDDVCISGKCLKFDGTNDYANTASSIDLSGTAVITVEFWMKWQPYADDDDLAMEFSTNANLSSTGFYINPNSSGASNFSIYLNGDVGGNSVQFTRPEDGVWHHYAIVMDKSQAGASEITPYVDGKAVSYTKSHTNNNTNNFGDNTLYFMSRAGSSLFGGGLMDEVKVFKYARTAAQIQSSYNSRSNPEGLSGQLGNSQTNASQGGLSDRLTHYWKMDEPSWTVDCSTRTVKDSAGSTDLISCDNATGPQTTSGKFGSAGSFDSVNDVIQADSTEVYGKRWTVSLWFKTSDTQGYLFDTRSIGDSGANGVAVFTDGASTFSFYQAIGGSNTTYNNYTSSTLDNNWHHLLVTRDGDNSISFYIDGTKLSGTPQISNADLTTLSETWKGASFGNRHQAGTYPLSGTLDEARFYKRGFSQSDVTALYNYGPSPIGYWSFDEGSGSTAYDKSGMGNNGTITGMSYVNGKVGKGVYSDGTAGNNINAGDATNVRDLYNKGGLTVTAWVQCNSGGNIMSKVDSWFYNNGWDFGLGNGVCTLYFVSPTSGTDIDVNSNSISYQSGWDHVAVTWTGASGAGAVKFYLNGVLLTTSGTEGTGTPTSDSGYDLVIGSNDAYNVGINAKMDEVKLYNYVRTPAQIVEDMNGNHPAPGSPVGSAVGYWKFDEGYGTTAYDSNTGTGSDDIQNLTLSSASWTNTGKFGKAFNGTGGAVRLSRTDDYNLDFTAAEDFSISLWFKSDSSTNPTANQWVVHKKTNNGNSVGYATYFDTSGFYCFGIDDDTTSFPEDSVCTSTDYYDGNWHHFLAKKTGTSRMDIYVDGIANGTPDTSISATGTLANAGDFYLADQDTDDNASAGAEELAGDLDEVKIFRSALTEPQIKLDMNRGASQVLGTLSNNAANQTGSTNTSATQEYCIPGDTSTCTSPVGRWDFEEGSGSTAYDTSGNANDCSHTDTYTPAKIGKAINYNEGVRLTCGSGSTMDDLPSTGLTAEAWIYPRDMGEFNWGAIINKSSDGANGWILAFDGTTTNGLYFRSDHATTDLNVITTNNAVTLNRWNHVAVTWTGSTTATTAKIYVNGREVSYGTQTNGSGARASDASETLFIGEVNGQTNGFDGIIDQARVFNYVRTPAQIAWDYNRGAPLAHWKMDECQGTTINNSGSAGSTYAGTLTVAGGGETDIGTCSTSSSAWGGAGGSNTGKRNYALNFDGTDDDVAISSELGEPPNVTLAAWVNVTGIDTGGAEIISIGDAVSLRVDSSTSLNTAGYFHAGSSVWHGTDSTLNIEDTGWRHVVYTFTPGSQSIYVDGILRGTTTRGESIVYDRGSSTKIGEHGNASGDYNLTGMIDDVRVYNYPLNAVQVKDLYNEGVVRFGPTTGAP